MESIVPGPPGPPVILLPSFKFMRSRMPTLHPSFGLMPIVPSTASYVTVGLVRDFDGDDS